MKAAPVAAENIRFWKMVRSSIGALASRSISTKSGSSSAAASSETITMGSFQPEMPPFETRRRGR